MYQIVTITTVINANRKNARSICGYVSRVRMCDKCGGGGGGLMVINANGVRSKPGTRYCPWLGYVGNDRTGFYRKRAGNELTDGRNNGSCGRSVGKGDRKTTSAKIVRLKYDGGI